MTIEEKYIEYDARIDRYLRNQMSDSERAAFEQDVDNDQELRERLVATSMLVQGIAQEGMRREGRAQLDAIKQMSQNEFKQAMGGNQQKKPANLFLRLATGIAAAAILAFCIYTFSPSTSNQQPNMAKVEKKSHKKRAKSQETTEPTLASLADEYNKSFGNEPDEFVEIRQQIKNSDLDDMMALINVIDQIELPKYNEGPKGAEDAEVIKEAISNYNDCIHWYKSLVYLKAENRESAIKELNELIDHGTVEELVNRASDLLMRLKE